MVAITKPYEIGAVIDRRYRIVGYLGQGGMGGVYLAEHLQFRRRVAIKVLLSSHQDDSSARARFETEARAICHLQHPNLVIYHDFGIDPRTGSHFLVMECLDGLPLSSVVKRKLPVPLSRVVHIVGQICDALTVAHDAGVIHRDLKPANVMLINRRDSNDAVKLIDFGIARVTALEQPAPRLTAQGMVIGTTAYLAPEYIQRQVVSTQMDIYALGVMTYELIAGYRPFRSDDQRELMLMHLTSEPVPLNQLSDGRVVSTLLNNTVMRALAKDPALRFTSVRAFKAHLVAAARPLLSESVAAVTHQQPFSLSDKTAPTVLEPGFEFATTRTGPPANEKPPLRSTETGVQSGLLAVSARPTAIGIALALAVVVGMAGTFGFYLADRQTLGFVSLAPLSELAVKAHTESMVGQVGSGTVRLLPLARRDSHEKAEFAKMFRHGLELEPAIGAEPVVSRDRKKRTKVTVIAEPYGAIFKSGKKLGNNKKSLLLQAGRHCFRAYNPLYGEKRACIRAKLGRKNTLRLRLRNGK